MDRRCIIWGQKPGGQRVYPRNMTARRWQNLANLGSFDVGTESLCQHVCALHLDTDQEFCSDSESTPDVGCLLRQAGGKIRHSPAMKCNCLGNYWGQLDAPPNGGPYPTTNKKTNGSMQTKIKQNRNSMTQESSNVDRCNISLQRCRGAQMQRNLYSQMRKNYYCQQSIGLTEGSAPEGNLKAIQPTVPLFCDYKNDLIPRDSNAVSEESSRPLMRSPSPAPTPCSCECGRQISPKTQNHNQQSPISAPAPFICESSSQRSQKNTQNLNQQSPSPAPAPLTCECSSQRSQKNSQNHNQQSPSPAPAPLTCECSSQRSQKNSQNHNQQNPSLAPATLSCECSSQRSQKNTQNLNEQSPSPAPAPFTCECGRQISQRNAQNNTEQSPSPAPAPFTREFRRQRSPKNTQDPRPCPLMRRPSPAPDPCTCKCSCQRSPKNTLNHIQPRPRSCDRLPCFACNQKKFQSSDYFNSSLSSSTGQSSSTTSEAHQEIKPKVKDKGCQASVKCQDQEVQCSQHSLQPDDSRTAVTTGSSTQPKYITIKEGCECDRSASLSTKYGRASSKSISSTGNIDMPNFEYAGEEQQISVNAVNVLLMNGSRQKPYEGPNPEICVQESDLTDCNEQAVFLEVDKPTYRVCRAATSGPNTKSQQDEANVLVLEKGSMDGCSPEDNSHQGQSQGELQFVEGMNSNQNQSSRSIDQGIQPGQFGDNWINSQGASNYTKLLELQKSRINELENLLEQHNKLQQTIQARIAELQCKDPAEKASKE